MTQQTRGARIARRVGAVLAALAVLATLTACSTRPAADSIVLYYSAGAGENKKFEECIRGGQSGSYPVDDEVFELPTSLRQWAIRSDGKGDSDRPIITGTLPIAPGQPGPEVSFYTSAEFYLNTDCGEGKGNAESPVVRFWEQTGRRYHVSANSEDGFNEGEWAKMLGLTLVPAQEKALNQEGRKYSADDIDANVDNVWRAIERDLSVGFAAELRAKVGGDYFCGVGYAGGKEVEWSEWVPDAAKPGAVKEEKRKGTCPPVRISITDVRLTNQAIADARARVYTEQQNAEAEKIKAQAQSDRARILNESANNPNYIELQRIEAQKLAAEACRGNQNCTMIIGSPGGVNVNAGR